MMLGLQRIYGLSTAEFAVFGKPEPIRDHMFKVALLIGIASPVLDMTRLHPYEYTDYNHLAGGPPRAWRGSLWAMPLPRTAAPTWSRRLIATGQAIPDDFEDAVVREVMATLPPPELLRQRLSLRYRVGVIQLGSEFLAEQRKAAEQRRRLEAIDAERRSEERRRQAEQRDADDRARREARRQLVDIEHMARLVALAEAGQVGHDAAEARVAHRRHDPAPQERPAGLAVHEDHRRAVPLVEVRQAHALPVAKP